jgi:hypothetical protein
MFDQLEPTERHFRYLMISWISFSAWAVILQTLLQKRIIAVTSWSYSPGWQREIGLWNVGAVLLLALSLASREPIAHITIPVICLWSTLFGTNHLVAYLRSGAHGHLNAAILNFAAPAWAAIVLLMS